MTRLTEYHNGVAVIKGKRFKEAAEILAIIEDCMEEYSDINPESSIYFLKGYCHGRLDCKGGGSDE